MSSWAGGETAGEHPGLTGPHGLSTARSPVSDANAVGMTSLTRRGEAYELTAEKTGTPGLLIAPVVVSVRECDDDGREYGVWRPEFTGQWQVVHVCGVTVSGAVPAFSLPASARLLAHRLAGLADWTQTPEELRHLRSEVSGNLPVLADFSSGIPQQETAPNQRYQRWFGALITPDQTRSNP